MKRFMSIRLLAMLLAIFLSGSALVSGTIAWFTDTGKSSDNVIQAGNLDLAVYAIDRDAFDGENTN